MPSTDRSNGPQAEGSTSAGTPLFHEDFSQFSVGRLPFDYSPVGEYHCSVPAGYMGRWTELTNHYSWRTALGWSVGKDSAKKYLEHAVMRKELPSILAAGDPLWSDCTIEVEVLPLGRTQAAGVAFRLVNSQEYYALLFDRESGASVVKASFDNTLTVLASSPLAPSDAPRHVVIRLRGSRITATVDGKVDVSVDDGSCERGMIGLVAFAPVRYYSISVAAEAPAIEAVAALRSREQRADDEARERLPRPVLWRSFELGDAGAGRSIRFGDLDGDGETEIVMAQCVQRGGTDNIAAISCVTAFKLTGEVLWQTGEPNSQHGIVTADLPIQIHDIDGDGADEVVLCGDFRIQVLDGRTGALKREAPTPSCLSPERKWSPDDIFTRLNGDSLFFADLSGRGAPREILVKNRYGRIWALDQNLEVLWEHGCKTGHAPFVGDVDGDGRDEVLIGSTLLGAQGNVVWHLDTQDHVDTAAVATLKEGADPIVLLACSDEGMYFMTTGGRVLRNDRLGHTQDLSVGRFRDDVPGLQFWTKTFWGHPGVLFLYTAELERVVTVQGYPLGSQVYPINWSGGELLHILLSAHPSLGGLMDGWGRKIPLMPDDGHPWLCCEPLDVTGDCRDEVLCWDLGRFWIYTQDRPPVSEPVRLSRNPHRNFTNYGCHFALRSD